MKLKVAAKVLFFNQGQVLIVGDPNDKWDFPGGGLEGDERLEQGLRRELQEELDFSQDFIIGEAIHVDEWFVEALDFHVIGIFYRSELAHRPEFTLSHEHSKVARVNLADLEKYDVTADTVRALKAAQSRA